MAGNRGTKNVRKLHPPGNCLWGQVSPQGAGGAGVLMLSMANTLMAVNVVVGTGAFTEGVVNRQKGPWRPAWCNKAAVTR